MSGPARILACRPALVAIATLVVGGGLSSRAAQLPNQQQTQQPPPATGMIMGQVVDAATGKPVPGAIVSLVTATPNAATAGITNSADLVEMIQQTGPNVPNRIISDADGRFVYRNLAKGRYGFTATANGYITGNYGQRRAGGPGVPVELETGERLLDATFRMWKAATITGSVLDEAGEPVVGVQVRSMRRTISAGRARWGTFIQAATDDRGIYRIPNLTPGDYAIVVQQSSISYPASTADAYREAMTSGSTTTMMRDLMSSNAPMPGSGGIPVGDQLLQTPMGFGAVSPSPGDDGRMLAYPTTYHPSAPTAARLTVVSLVSGEERTAVDVQLRLVPTVRVSGTVSGPEGPVPNIGVRLIPAGMEDFATDLGFESALTLTDPGGAFTFLGVPAGTYTVKVLKMPRPAAPVGASEGSIMVSTGSGGISFGTSVGSPITAPPLPALPTEPTLWGTAPLAVGTSNIAGVSITLRTGVRVTGRLEFQGTRQPPTPDQIQRMSVSLQPLDPRSGGVVTPGRVSTDLQFRTMEFPPGRYNVTAGGAGMDWTLKSAMFNGRDISDEPLEIGSEEIAGVVLVFTDRQAQVTGTVRNAQNQGDADADVVVFPANHQLWKEVVNPRRARSVRTTKNGSYTVPNLPPGDYYIVAISATTTRDWQDPKFLEAAAPQATRITILDGDQKTQDLRTSRVR